jgi:hypothetical protein
LNVFFISPIRATCPNRLNNIWWGVKVQEMNTRLYIKFIVTKIVIKIK